VTTRKDGSALRQLNTLFKVGAMRELTDGQLLERFSTGPGEVAELAFEALVKRHGAMVLRVCRAQLVDPHDTQDAFQATFLILIKKARGLWVRDSLGPWLHQVAFRTASCARSAAARRRRHEQSAARIGASLGTVEDWTGSEVEKALHEEINRLPECYRVPIVLCDLQGYTCEEAARRMGRPVGTVKSWRFRGRARLRDRLIRLRLAPMAGPCAALPISVARPALPEAMVRVAVRALRVGMTTGEAPASVRVLVKGVLATMFVNNLRTTAAAVFAVSFLTVGLLATEWVVADDLNRPPGKARTASPSPALLDLHRPIADSVKEPAGDWPLTLAEAIRLGLDNADEIRVISPGGKGTPTKIAPRNRGVDTQRFKAMVMAHVRSIEQQYWNLAQANVQLWIASQAVMLAQGVVNRESAGLKVGRGTSADVAAASQRLENFNLDLVSKTSDAITAERQFRTILGLAPTDGRRVVPVTVPTEAQLEPDWEESLAVMLKNQPDVVRSRTIMAKEPDGASDGSGLAQLERRKDFHKQVIHQATHALSRMFLEIDANFKQFMTARQLRASAAIRLESARAMYEEGRWLQDRFLDAIATYHTAVANEAQYKTTYNISIVAFEEVKGTLLEHDKITVVDGPKSRVSIAAVPDFAVNAARYEPPTRTMPRAQDLQPGEPQGPAAMPHESRTNPSEPKANDASSKAGEGGKTFSFHVTLGIGSKPVDIRGSFTITPAQPEGGSKAP
jgi:RNA polymerase sigma factor (sigma-70 family)